MGILRQTKIGIQEQQIRVDLFFFYLLDSDHSDPKHHRCVGTGALLNLQKYNITKKLRHG